MEVTHRRPPWLSGSYHPRYRPLVFDPFLAEGTRRRGVGERNALQAAVDAAERQLFTRLSTVAASEAEESGDRRSLDRPRRGVSPLVFLQESQPCVMRTGGMSAEPHGDGVCMCPAKPFSSCGPTKDQDAVRRSSHKH